MRRAPSQSLLGPALLLYLVADVSAAQGQLDFAGALLVVLAGALSLAPAALSRVTPMPGSARVASLALVAGYALVRAIAPLGLSLAVDVAGAFGAAAVGVLAIDLALTVPEPAFTAGPLRAARVLNIVAGVALGVAGMLAQAPALTIGRETWIPPSWLCGVPLAGAALELVVALGLRLRLQRRGGAPEALASNTWAVAGLVAAVAIAIALWTAWLLGIAAHDPLARGARGLLAATLVWTHMRLVDPSRRLSVGPAMRSALPALLAVSLSAALCVVIRPLWPSDPLVLGVAIGCAFLAASAFHHALRDAARVLLAPASGRVLRAMERAHVELSEACDLTGVARVALAAARNASGDPNAEPLLYLIEPARGLRADAAGNPHSDILPMHKELVRALRERQGQPILRAQLETHIVRQPALRPLIETLVGLDALCVLPLLQRGELEGAWIVPRAGRSSGLTLEELDALQRFSRHLTGFVALLCAEERGQERAAQARFAAQHAELELATAQAELSRVSAEARALRSGFAVDRSAAALLAYSAKMRELLQEITRAAPRGMPLLLTAERGLPLPPLARLFHEQAGRAAQPFVVFDCAAARKEHVAARMFGAAEDAPATPGALRLAADGTLLLIDLPALPLPVQRTLAQALRERKAHAVDAEEGASYACGARVVASCRCDPQQLVLDGALERELLDCFAQPLRVPPLRERPEDLQSLLLLALDHSARVLGRPVVGFEPEAQQRLLTHDWPGNLDELHAVVELAFMRCAGARIGTSDLPLLGPPQPATRESGHPLDGTFERVERRVLARALERADGNKSEAARLLGLPRTTFLDKLRRYGLDEGASSSSSGGMN